MDVFVNNPKHTLCVFCPPMPPPEIISQMCRLCWARADCRLELQTINRRSCTITEKAPTHMIGNPGPLWPLHPRPNFMSTCRGFQPGEGPSKGLLRDCTYTTSPINRLQLYCRLCFVWTLGQNCGWCLPQAASSLTAISRAAKSVPTPGPARLCFAAWPG